MASVSSRSHSLVPKFHHRKKELIELVGEPEPGYISTQKNYFSRAEQDKLANQTVEELQQHAVKQSQDTTRSIKNAMKIATETQQIGVTTLETLDDQGKQIHRTHMTAVFVDEELGRGEKLLGSLGGLISAPWRPKKAHKITGPVADTEQYKSKLHAGERQSLGLSGESHAARSRAQVSSGKSAYEVQLEMEKHTQDEALSDLSGVLGQLKGITLEMGNEIDRQNGSLDLMHDDIHELNNRVTGANHRTRHLLGR